MTTQIQPRKEVIDDPKKLKESLKAIFDDIKDRFLDVDFTEQMEDAQELLIDKHRQHFDGWHDPTGLPWRPLSPITIRRKGHDTPLVDSGRLKASVLEVDHPDHAREIDDRSLIFGSYVEYGRFHQDGTGRIPQREFAGMDSNTADEIVGSVADACVTALIFT